MPDVIPLPPELDIKVLFQDVARMAERLDRVENLTQDIADLNVRVEKAEVDIYLLAEVQSERHLSNAMRQSSCEEGQTMRDCQLSVTDISPSKSVHTDFKMDGDAEDSQVPRGDPVIARISEEIDQVRVRLLNVRARLLQQPSADETEETVPDRCNDEGVGNTVVSLLMHMELTVSEFQQSWYDLCDLVGYAQPKVCGPPEVAHTPPLEVAHTPPPMSTPKSSSAVDLETATPELPEGPQAERAPQAERRKMEGTGIRKTFQFAREGFSSAANRKPQSSPPSSGRRRRWSLARPGLWRKESKESSLADTPRDTV